MTIQYFCLIDRRIKITNNKLSVLFIIYNFKMQFRECPVLTPTLQQFADFDEFVNNLDSRYKRDFGMVKVIPPPTWKPNAGTKNDRLAQMTIKNPIEQMVQGTRGYYEVKNIVQKSMSFKAYKRYAESESAKVNGKTPQEKQQLFWKTLTYSAPIYGADLTGTLMDQTAGSWNMNSMGSILRNAFSSRVRGVNEPYCYIGSWKAFFSWHKEDLDLSAINYIHEGQAKIWYSIASSDSQILQEEARQNFRKNYQECPQFLRHKTILINPQVLAKKYPELKISRIQHNKNEIILVFGGAYHCGFNCGLNVAQAVNYATVDWLEQLINARYCKCSKHSVKCQREAILYNLQNSSIFQELAFKQQFLQLQKAVREDMEQQMKKNTYKKTYQNSILQNQIDEKQQAFLSEDNPKIIKIDNTCDKTLDTVGAKQKVEEVFLHLKTKKISKKQLKKKKEDKDYKPYIFKKKLQTIDD